MNKKSKIAQLLSSADANLREEALEKLQEEGAIIDFEEIAHLSSDSDSFVRKAFLDTVDIYGDKIARQFAITGLNDNDELVRITAAEIFLDFLPVEKKEFTLLSNSLDDPDPVVRRTVAEVFGYAGDRSYISLLNDKFACDKTCQARLGIAFALYKLGDENHLHFVLDALKSLDYHDRCVAARILKDLFFCSENNHVLEALKNALVNEKTIAGKDAISAAVTALTENKESM